MGYRFLFLLLFVVSTTVTFRAHSMPMVGINGAACAFDTISDAIAAASSDDIIYVSAGVYLEQPGLVDKSLRFEASDTDCGPRALLPLEPDVSITAFGGLGSLFRLDSASESPITVSFVGFTFSNAIGEDGGLMEVLNADVTVELSLFTLGSATNGGCVFVAGGTLQVSTSRFFQCRATGDGGAAYVLNGGLTVLGTTFESNSAASGGAIYVSNTAPGNQTLSISSAMFQDNGATLTGGALAIRSSNTIMDTGQISQSTFSNNQAVAQGGAISLFRWGQMMLENVTIDGNRTTGDSTVSLGGGGIEAVESSMHLSNVMLTNNRTEIQGGGMRVISDPLVEVVGGEISGNQAALGAGIIANSTDLRLSGTTMMDNMATGNGGGLAAFFSDLSVSQGHFLDNDAGRAGGGVYLRTSNGLFDNSQFVGNSAATGGGLSILADSSLTVRATSTGTTPCRSAELPIGEYCSHFRDNSATTNGGAISIERSAFSTTSSTVLIDTTAFTGNFAPAHGTHLYATAVDGPALDMDDVVTIRNAIAQRGEFVSGGIDYPEAIYLGERTQLTLDSTTVATNPGPALLAEGPDSRLTLRNTILWDNVGESFASETEIAISTSCAFSEAEQINSRDLGEEIDPQFIDDPSRGGLRLDPLVSPLVDACFTGPAEDLDGFGRAAGAGYEPGAFEIEGEDVQLLAVTPVTGLTTDEGGASDIITVSLRKAPLEEVTLAVVAQHPAEALVDQSELLFTPETWDQPQELIVSGIDDSANDGDQTFEIVIGPGASDDSVFENSDMVVVSGINADNDGESTVDEIFADGFE